MNNDSGYWIEKLGLVPHPEGGYFRETYRSKLGVIGGALPADYGSARAASTAIYFLLEGTAFSALHRLRSDEVWHFYAGSALAVDVIEESGIYGEIRLGLDLEAGATPQAVVHAGCWFGARLTKPESFALVGCTVAPGFDFADFELGERSRLLRLYPQHRDLIERLTRA